MMVYKRGNIYLANLNPPKKSEPGKIRPVLVIQTDNLNEVSHPSTIIIPLTTNLIDNMTLLRFRITKRGKLNANSDLLIDQIRAIDNTRLIPKEIANLSMEEMKKIEVLITKVLGIAST